MIRSARQVTLGDQARAAAARHQLSARQVQLARFASTSTYDTPEFLVVIGIAGERRIEMRCAHDQPEHIVKLRLT